MIKDKSRRAFLTSAIVLTLAIWPIAFTIGAYDTVFYTDVLKLWFASLVGATALLLAPKGGALRERVSTGMILSLLMPSFAFIFEVYNLNYGNDMTEFLSLVLIVVTLFWAGPVLVYLMIVSLLPDALEMRDPSMRRALIGIAVLVFIIAFTLGRFNAVFMSCQDFDIAGDARPEHCYDLNKVDP